VSTTRARYDEIADFYAAEVGPSIADPVATALFELAGDVAGLRVLDLACGEGRVTRELARRDARSCGIDISGALIERARALEAEQPLGVSYVHRDAAVPDALEPEAFDAVVCHFGLSDIDDLAGVLATVARVLRPDGFAVFSILHPCFPGLGAAVASSWPPGQGYFREGWWQAGADSSVIRRRVGSNHRTLSTYLNGLADAGMAIERAAEPPPPADWLAKHAPSELGPVFLVLRCRKG